MKRNNNKALPELQEPYSQPIWDVSQHHFYKEDGKDKKKDESHKIFFDRINNPHIRKELQVYCFEIIEKKKISWLHLLQFVRSVHRSMDYLNTKPKINSILDISKETILEEYPTFLESIGMKAYTSSTYLTAKDGYKKYPDRCKTPHFSCVLRFHDLISDIVLPLMEKDIWYIKKLPFEVEGLTDHCPRHTLNFSEIKQPGIKLTVKCFAEFSLGKKINVPTIRNDIVDITQFAKFLLEKYPKIKSFSSLKRSHIDKFFESLNESSLEEITKDKRKGQLRQILTDMFEYKIPGAPQQKLISSREILSRSKKDPKPYTDEELSVLVPYLHLLPDIVRRMYAVISAIGMRSSELCMLKITDFKEGTDGFCVLDYYQRKTRKYNICDLRSSDMSEARKALKEAIEDSRKIFGPDSIYIFPTSKDKPFHQNRFTNNMKRLIVKNDIKINGELFAFKAHRLRKTKASKDNKAGKSYKLITKGLGLVSLRSGGYYIPLPTPSEVFEAIQQLLKTDGHIIANIGNKDVVEQFYSGDDIVLLPLSNGKCAKPVSQGSCKSLDVCYTCPMFRPMSEFLGIYKSQREQAMEKIIEAETKSLLKEKEILENLVKKLDRVITSIETAA